MISVQPLKSAQGAADYYHAVFNYYAGDAQALRWLGEGAKELGLQGVVEKEIMLSLLEGKLPTGEVLQNKKGEHRPGFDMTFSAPKSVSILVGLTGDKTLIACHDKAVEKAVKAIESEFAQARVVKDGIVHYVDTKSLVVAAFRQLSSRTNDPDLHTHAVTMNITFTTDSRARSLASDIHKDQGVIEQLQKYITYAGLLYRSELANSLKESGYRITETGRNGLFELEDFPPELLEEFSTRRTAIEAFMKEKGWEGARLAAKAALLTRPAKEEHEVNVLRADWEKRASALRFDAPSFIKQHLEEKGEPASLLARMKEKLFSRFFEKEDLIALAAKEAVFTGMEALAARSSVFEHRHLKEMALRHSLTGKTIVPLAAIEREIHLSLKANQLYEAEDPVTGRTLLTTPWALTMETETLARISHNQGVLKPMASKACTLRHVAAYEAASPFPLTPSQKNAFIDIMTSKDRFHALQGYAGTGKTTLLKQVKDLSEEKGFELRGVAVTSAAVNELRAKAGIASEVFPLIHQELLRAPNDSLKHRFYILDEASMLSTSQGHELIKLIEQKGARLLLAGDDDQLPSVQCGRLFGQSQHHGIAVSRMTDIIRQPESRRRESVSDAIHRELHDSLQKLNEVRENESHEARIDAMASHWLALSPDARERTLMFAPTHANRRDITALVREGLKKEGVLAGEEYFLPVLKPKPIEEVQVRHSQYYREGDVLRFNLNLPRFKIAAGDYFTVGRLTSSLREKKELSLIASDGKALRFPLSELPSFKPTRAGLNRPLEVYEKGELALCVNDQLVITRNQQQRGLVNSALARVKAIDEASLSLVMEDTGEEKTFPLHAPELQHIDHGYVLTNMKAQGRDKFYGLGLMESTNRFSATLKNYYVQISRAVVSMTLITDNKKNLLKALEFNDDKKKSALDYVSPATLKAHEERFKGHAKSLDISAVSRQKEDMAAKRVSELALVSLYNEAKLQQKPSLAAGYAFKIVESEALKTKARRELALSETTLRQDALVLATHRYLKGLSPEEQKNALTVKAWLTASSDAKQAWRNAHLNPANTLQKTIAADKSALCNELAFKIVDAIKTYRPHLGHFSVGTLNRLGLPQYRIAEEEARAVKRLSQLGEQAASHALYLKAKSFFKDKESGEREVLAFDLKKDSKALTPALARLSRESARPLDSLWRELNLEAKRHEGSLFRAGLSQEGQQLFDELSSYKTLNRELAVTREATLYALESGHALPPEAEQKQTMALALRNAIAAKVEDSTVSEAILSFFNLTKERLQPQANAHQRRETVKAFQASSSDFKQRRNLARLMGDDIKGHYPFMKELGVDSKRFNAFLRIDARVERFEAMAPHERKNYSELLAYKVTQRKAGALWGAVFKAAEAGHFPARHKIADAQALTAKRDALACQLEQSNMPAALLSEERLDAEKIAGHANQHRARLNTLAALGQQKETLLTRLEGCATRMSPAEARHWHRQWQDFTRHKARIQESMPLYQQAIKHAGVSLSFSEAALKSLHHYELPVRVKAPTKLSPVASEYFNAEHINGLLIANPEETYRAIFGEPKKMTAKEMRYSGGLIVSLKGAKAGCWYDFAAGEGGSPLQAIMKERGLDFKEALKEGASLAGSSGSLQRIYVAKPRDVAQEFRDEKNRLLSAKSIVNASILAKGTLAETYLKRHRGIETIANLNVRLFPKGAPWKTFDEEGNCEHKINKIPALVLAAHNEKGEVTGVQRIYLDEKTGGKNTFMDTVKLSKGKIEGSAGILQKGILNGQVYLAEGIETGASIAMANPKATVLVSFGISNLKNLSELVKRFKPIEVIIAADNDLKAQTISLKETKKAQAILSESGLHVTIKMPPSLPNKQKTDWNDVHREKGLHGLKNELHFGESIKAVSQRNHAEQKADLRLINPQDKPIKVPFNPMNDIKIPVHPDRNKPDFKRYENQEIKTQKPIQRRDLEMEI